MPKLLYEIHCETTKLDKTHLAVVIFSNMEKWQPN